MELYSRIKLCEKWKERQIKKQIIKKTLTVISS